MSVPLCLRSGSGPLPAAAADKSAYVWSHPDGHKSRQVVMLGAGMDSRPWRMKLPSGERAWVLGKAPWVGQMRGRGAVWVPGMHSWRAGRVVLARPGKLCKPASFAFVRHFETVNTHIQSAWC